MIDPRYGFLGRGMLALALLACSPSEPSSTTAGESDRQPPAATRFPFSNTTEQSGIQFVHDNGAVGRRSYVETMGPGVCLFDADDDGDLDVYAVNGGPLEAAQRPGNGLFLNRGDGTFEDRSAASGADDHGYGMGCVVADVDGDDDSDIYVLNFGPNVLLRNDGGARFTAISSGAEDPTWSVSATFFDLDGDGDLDLYVANYLRYSGKEPACRAGTLEIYCSPEQYPPTTDRLFRNEGGGRFTDISTATGVVPDGRGMGIAASDFDLDGDLDLYVTNDRSPNFLYLNEGGRLREVGMEAGVGYSSTGMAEGGMGVVTGDLTGGGRPAFFFTNFQKEPNRLFVAATDIFFDDLTNQSGLGPISHELVSWGIAAFDFDGDTDLDLAIANGHVFDNAEEFIPGSAFALADLLFESDGSGRFRPRPFPGPPLSSRSLVAGDLDGDGDPDLVISSCGDELRVWRNEAGDARRFVLVRLEGESPNTDAFGARVSASIGERSTWREVTSGGSYASQGDPRATFGLGEAAQIDRLEVRWPDGSIESAEAVAGGQEIVWRQGAGIVERRPLEGREP